jgi:5'-deoxynucleotidase
MPLVNEYPLYRGQWKERMFKPKEIYADALFNTPVVPPIFKFVNEYESIFRFSRSRLIWPETLMQHAGEVAIIGGYLIDHINSQKPTFSEMDYAEFMRRALVHDMEEVITGDIARPTKYANEELKNKLKELEYLSAVQVINHYELPHRWITSWNTAKEGRIGWLVKVADCATVMMTCYREIGLVSNKSFIRVGEEAVKYARALVEELAIKTKEDDDKFMYEQLQEFLTWTASLVKSTMEGAR